MNRINKIYFAVLVDITAEERLSSLVKKLRGDKSQRQFSKVLGVSYAAVRSWEECESMPGLNSLQKAVIFDYSVGSMSPKKNSRSRRSFKQ
jgi:DNA-binding transcriptional regulator YiaG